MDVIKTQEISSRAIEKAMVHPLVLLSRVVGVLLGSSFKGTVDVTNSYAAYNESMFSMFKRTNAKEHVVGWYNSGPKLRENDLDIYGLFNDKVPNPVLIIIDDATQKGQKVFVHVLSENCRVEHLLRDVKDTTVSSLATDVYYLDLAIDGKLPLNHKILYYLQIVYCHLNYILSFSCSLCDFLFYFILSWLSLSLIFFFPFHYKSSLDVFNLHPKLNVTELIKVFADFISNITLLHFISCLNFKMLFPVMCIKTNGMMLVIYLASLIRCKYGKTEVSKPVSVPAAAGS
ncbi:hypothetical protein UlMin_009146 [Ulmus minor]